MADPERSEAEDGAGGGVDPSLEYVLKTAIEIGLAPHNARADLSSQVDEEEVLRQVSPAVRLLLDRQAKEIAEGIEALVIDLDLWPGEVIREAADVARDWMNRE